MKYKKQRGKKYDKVNDDKYLFYKYYTYIICECTRGEIDCVFISYKLIALICHISILIIQLFYDWFL